MVKTTSHRLIFIACFAFISIAALIITPFIGMENISPKMLWQDLPAIHNIFWNIRVPRVMTAWLIGAMLALSGMVFQAILRNPLAEPFTLGIASGSALGAAIYIHTGITFSFWLFSGLSFAAFIGATLITFLIYSLNKNTLESVSRLLLVGVILSFFCSSLVMVMQAIGRPQDSYRLMQWMMGTIANVSYHEIGSLLIVMFISTITIALFTPKLNLLSAGHTIAITRGINPTYTFIPLFFLVSLMMGTMIAVSGPIGFVGLVIPHIARQLIGHDHRYLWLAVIFLGGGILVLADLAARLLFAPSELPVGVITALLGAPFFILILIKDKKN